MDRLALLQEHSRLRLAELLIEAEEKIVRLKIGFLLMGVDKTMVDALIDGTEATRRASAQVTFADDPLVAVMTVDDLTDVPGIIPFPAVTPIDDLPHPYGIQSTDGRHLGAPFRGPDWYDDVQGLDKDGRV